MRSIDSRHHRVAVEVGIAVGCACLDLHLATLTSSNIANKIFLNPSLTEETLHVRRPEMNRCSGRPGGIRGVTYEAEGETHVTYTWPAQVPQREWRA